MAGFDGGSGDVVSQRAHSWHEKSHANLGKTNEERYTLTVTSFVTQGTGRSCHVNCGQGQGGVLCHSEYKHSQQSTKNRKPVELQREAATQDAP